MPFAKINLFWKPGFLFSARLRSKFASSSNRKTSFKYLESQIKYGRWQRTIKLHRKCLNLKMFCVQTILYRKLFLGLTVLVIFECRSIHVKYRSFEKISFRLLYVFKLILFFEICFFPFHSRLSALYLFQKLLERPWKCVFILFSDKRRNTSIREESYFYQVSQAIW